MKKQGQQGST